MSANDAHMCAVCGVGLDTVDGRPAHARDTLKEPDHVAVPVPYASLPLNFECDFCSATLPQSAAPSLWVVIHEPFAIAMLGGGGPGPQTLTYSSPWLACPSCTPAVKAHDWDAVMKRTALPLDASTRTLLRTLYNAVEATLIEERPWKPEDLDR